MRVLWQSDLGPVSYPILVLSQLGLAEVSWKGIFLCNLRPHFHNWSLRCVFYESNQSSAPERGGAVLPSGGPGCPGKSLQKHLSGEDKWWRWRWRKASVIILWRFSGGESEWLRVELGEICWYHSLHVGLLSEERGNEEVGSFTRELRPLLEFPPKTIRSDVSGRHLTS